MDGGPGSIDALDEHLSIEALQLNPAWRVPSTMLAAEAADEMAACGYDHAPTAADTTIVCSLRTLKNAPVSSFAVDHAISTQPEQRLTPGSSLRLLRRVLRAHEYAVVRDTLGGVGIVTRADLAHPAFTSSVFNTVMVLEQGLNEFL